MATQHSSGRRPHCSDEAERLNVGTSAPSGSVEGLNRFSRSALIRSGEADLDQTDLAALDDTLARFSEALALVETAHGALDKAQEDESPIGAGVLTLHRGIEELKSVYTEFDLSLVHLRRQSNAP